MPFCIGWVENFDEIALSRMVKEIEANFCFSIFGKNSKWPPFLGRGNFFLKIAKSTLQISVSQFLAKIQNGRHFWEEEIFFLKIAKSTLQISVSQFLAKIQNGRHFWEEEIFF